MTGNRAKSAMHHNALGYVVGTPDEQMTVWGFTPDGRRVIIDDAERGGGQGLVCACGSPLIARKGDVRIHHFAHASGGSEACRRALLAALDAFAISALAAGRTIQLPWLDGSARAAAFQDVTSESRDGQVQLTLAASRGGFARQLAVVFTVAPWQTVPPREDFVARGLSAIHVDLAAHRNRSDEALADAIVRTAGRRWIHNERFPEAHRQPRPSSGPRTTVPRSGLSRKSKPLISAEEWQSLSPRELRRRLFGDKYDR